jgi:catechol 2,3-dioxygenase-like lactoylglutathione lyase family enzyme
MHQTAPATQGGPLDEPAARAEALAIATAGGAAMPASFRYIVNDVDRAIDFYTRLLDFKLEMHPAPPFAEISRGDMHIYLSQPGAGGGGAAMAGGEVPKPGGWNRIHLPVEDLDATVARLKAAGAIFRNDIVTGIGGRQILLEDPSGNLVELFQPIAR